MLIESTKNRRFICLTLKRERTSIWIDQDTILSVMELESGGSCVVYTEHIHKFAVDVEQLHGDIIASITSPRIKPPVERKVTGHKHYPTR